MAENTSTCSRPSSSVTFTVGYGMRAVCVEATRAIPDHTFCTGGSVSGCVVAAVTMTGGVGAVTVLHGHGAVGVQGARGVDCS